MSVAFINQLNNQLHISDVQQNVSKELESKPLLMEMVTNELWC